MLWRISLLAHSFGNLTTGHCRYVRIAIFTALATTFPSMQQHQPLRCSFTALAPARTFTVGLVQQARGSCVSEAQMPRHCSILLSVDFNFKGKAFGNVRPY